MEIKRKTSLQLEALEEFYGKHKYPTQSAIKEIAAILGLSLKQIRGWFCKKRRKDKGITEALAPSLSSGRRGAGVSNRGKSAAASSKIGKPHIIQELLTPDYILKNIFREEGPPLGTAREFPAPKGLWNPHLAWQDTQRAPKRRKLKDHALMDKGQDSDKSEPVRRHGVGKGLMKAWRVTNPDGGCIPTGVNFANRHVIDTNKAPNFVPQKPQRRNREPKQLASKLKQKMLEKKLKNKRKAPIKRRVIDLTKDESQKQPQKEKCKLALEGETSQGSLNQFTLLVDDEELEERELQLRQNPLNCEHDGLGGCSLCRDFLPTFPPASVKMKLPFTMQPWDSSPKTVKKLFKVFHFLYTYSVTLDVCPFTLDEFAQSLHDKDSLLLAKIHVALLKLLLSDIETELNSGLWPNLCLSCNFLALLNSVENQVYVLKFWRGSLNPLTWIEILRQVLIAAGFGSKQGDLKKEPLSKETSLMKKYGLHSGTLKGELFKLLLEQGNKGLSISELLKTLSNIELNIACTSDELEQSICSTLASDITLFEKISSSSYRLRISCAPKEADNSQSDTEESASVHDEYSLGSCSSSDSEFDSGNASSMRRKHKIINKSSLLSLCTEIDESQPGELWLLGLMEGEYSGLSIDEKLSSLVALIDILSAGSSIRVEDPARKNVETVPNIHNYGSGGKIKKASTQKRDMARPSWIHGQVPGAEKTLMPMEFLPVDSSALILKHCTKESSSGTRKNEKEREAEIDLHPMQSVFLGSDRRHNRYWLFLGPCNECDPGHRRVYFECSEDGHWEVIDTEEVLRALLSVLDERGSREALLIESLEKRGDFLYHAMASRVEKAKSDHSGLEIVRENSISPVSEVDNLSLTVVSKDFIPQSGAIFIEVGKNRENLRQKWSRLQEFDSWIWDEFYLQLDAVKYSKRSYIDALNKCETCHDLYWRDEKHCKMCHNTFELDFDLEERYAIHAATCREKSVNDDNDIFPNHKVLPSELQSLKAAIHAIESIMPEASMVGAWTKSAHRLWVKRLRRTSSLLELLQAVSDFAGAIKEDWLNKCAGLQEIISCFPSIPQTSSAFALWLVKLDASISPYMKKAPSGKKPLSGAKVAGTRAAAKE